MNFLKNEHEDYDRLLGKEPQLIQMDICRFITDYLKNHSPATISWVSATPMEHEIIMFHLGSPVLGQ
jgi:hypothetical protein